MSDDQLRRFLRESVGFMETSGREPNKAYFAGTDKSGLSYGGMQNDTGSNAMARAALGAMLMKEGMTQGEWGRLDPVLATKGLTKDSLESRYAGALTRIDDALAANSEFVKNMDGNSLTHVVDEVKRVFGAAKGRGGFNPDNPNWTMVGEAGAWANQVPDLKDTAEAIGAMPEITNDAFDAYMRQRDYFNKNDPNPPKRWGDWRGRIDEGTRRGLAAIAPEGSVEQPVNMFNSASPPPPEPEVRMRNSEVDAGPAPGNLLNANALPDNLFNMPDYERRKWGIR